MKKRVLNGKAVALIAFLLLILISLYKVPRFLNLNHLHKLGYSDEAIEAIYDQGLKSTILKNEYYSDYLNQEIVKEGFKKEYLRLYLVRSEVNEDDLYLYERLKTLKGYSEDELLQLFASLNYPNLLPLVVFDKVEPAGYIADALKHPNTLIHSSFDEDYLHIYENVITAADPADITVPVSKKISLGEYVPNDLVNLNSMNAIPNIQLRKEAAAAFDKLCEGLRQAGSGCYAISGYRSFADQKAAYESYRSEKEADEYLARAGHSEYQSGLTVSVKASESDRDETISFEASSAYDWLKKNAYKYGFIFRYPEGKQDLTDYDPNPKMLRYVGVELAEKLQNSGISFEEYYFLNLYDTDAPAPADPGNDPAPQPAD